MMTKFQFQFHEVFPGVDPASIPFFSILDRFYEGVVIADHEGRIRYFNDAQARIDDLETADVIGRSTSDLYKIDDDDTPIMKCLSTRRVVENFPCYYRTRLGRVINSIHNVFPLFSGDTLVGAICFVRDYNIVERTFETISQPHQNSRVQRFDAAGKSRDAAIYNNGTRFVFEDMIGTAPGFSQAVTAARLASDSPSSIMLSGETGTGKELMAQSIHNAGSRHRKPFIAINCAAIPEHLLEGILFGTIRGAFTGAMDKQGIFEQAHGGTLFLDEVNAMSVGLQAKLLRVLQERKVRRVGSLEEIDIDLRIISSVNEDPHSAAARGALRYDLLYRLGVVMIRIPPLRERMGDMDALITHFLQKFNGLLGKEINGISADVMTLFRSYPWPGNVRELEHVIEGAANLVHREERVIQKANLPYHFQKFTPDGPGGNAFVQGTMPPVAGGYPDSPTASPPAGSPPPPSGPSLPSDDPGARSLGSIQAKNEYRAICDALTRFQGNVSRSAKELGISPQLLHYKMKKHGLDRRDYLV